MALKSNDLIKECLRDLSFLLNPEKDDQSRDDQINKALRLLRTAGNPHEHAGAIRMRLRQRVLNHPSTSSDGPLLLSSIEKNCDKISELNPNILNPFLALFLPLSFQKPEATPVINVLRADFNLRSKPKAFGVNTTTHNNNRIPSQPNQVSPPMKMEDSAFSERKEEYEKDDRTRLLVKSNAVWVDPETEQKLITDLLFVFQGIAGTHIKYDCRTESYVLDPSLALIPPVRDIVLLLCELGWLYSRVAQYLKKVFQQSSKVGLVEQAFGFALQEEIHDYYRLLAVLEKQLKPENTHLKNSKIQTFEKHETSLVPFEGKLTLVRLRAWMSEPIDRMCLLARLIDAAAPLKGGALASSIFCHLRHGDVTGQQELVKRLLTHTTAPIYKILSRWLLYGELNDPHQEFFITTVDPSKVKDRLNPSLAHTPLCSTDLWRDKYFVNLKMYPNFLPPQLARKILVVGKSINFLHLCLEKLPKKTPRNVPENVSQAGEEKSAGENTDIVEKVADKKREKKIRRSVRQVNKNKHLTLYGRVHDEIHDDDSSSVNPEIEPTEIGWEEIDKTWDLVQILEVEGGLKITRNHQDPSAILSTDLTFGDEAKLTSLVSGLAANIDRRLLTLLTKDFHLHTHLLALKKFMLLGQGDFVTCLMDAVGPELKKRANQLFRHNLTGVLEGALRASNAQFEPSFVLERISIRLLESLPGDTGWEVFSLDYSLLDSPLVALVDPEALGKYRIAFHMLWRLRRVEWVITSTWKNSNSFFNQHYKEITGRIKTLLHRNNLNRAQMMHFVNNFCAYLMFEVLESAWNSLQTATEQAKCLDDVIIAHDAYLSEILSRALLAPEYEEVNLLLQQLLQTILRFCNLEDSLIADSLTSIARRHVARSVQEEKTKNGNWGSLGEIEEIDDEIPEHIVERLDETVSEYNRQFDELTGLLNEQGEIAGEILRFLTFRLDFNGFHNFSDGRNVTGQLSTENVRKAYDYQDYDF